MGDAGGLPIFGRHDLNPCDYWRWRRLKSELRESGKHEHDAVAKLGGALLKITASLKAEDIEKACELFWEKALWAAENDGKFITCKEYKKPKKYEARQGGFFIVIVSNARGPPFWGNRPANSFISQGRRIPPHAAAFYVSETSAFPPRPPRIIFFAKWPSKIHGGSGLNAPPRKSHN